MQAIWCLEKNLRLLERVHEVCIYQANPRPIEWLLKFGRDTRMKLYEMKVELEAFERIHFLDTWAPGYGEGLNRFPTHHLRQHSHWFIWGTFAGPS